MVEPKHTKLGWAQGCLEGQYPPPPAPGAWREQSVTVWTSLTQLTSIINGTSSRICSFQSICTGWALC